MSSGATLPVTSKPSSNGKATTHMRLLPGEDEVFRVSELGGCAWARNEDNMVVTTQRVLFLRRHWVFSLCFASLEEAFYLNDLQFVCLTRAMSIIWLQCALIGIILGAVLLGVADATKPKPTTTSNSYYYASSSYNFDTAASTTYSVCLGLGIVFLLAGVACLVTFIIKHLRRGVELRLNFSRKDVGILDWHSLSWWKPRMSSTRRVIKLPKPTAQEAYNALNSLLHEKFSLKVKPRTARDSAYGIE